MRRLRGPSDSPPDDPFAPSELVESVLGVLEDADVSTFVSDTVVRLIEADEMKRAERDAETDALIGMLPPDLVAHHLHPSSERRRGLEEAAQRCLHVGSTLSNQYARRGARECAKAIRALIPPSSEGGEEKTDG